MKRGPRTSPLPFAGGVEDGGRLVPTRALLRNRSCRRVLDRVRAVLFFFPELDDLRIRVGLTRAAQGYASLDEPAIWMNPYRLSHLTITHELVHLVQSRGILPGGEKTADLYALARHLSLVDDLPAYLRVPRGLARAWDRRGTALPRLLHRTAREAIDESDGKRRRAIRRFEETVHARWEETREALPGTEARLPQIGLFG